MKTPYEVQQEIERIQRLVPHLIADQGDRAEEILGFHIAGLYASAPPEALANIRERVAVMQRQCREAARERETEDSFALAAARA